MQAELQRDLKEFYMNLMLKNKVPDTEDPVYDTLAALLGEGDISLSFEKYILKDFTIEGVFVYE